MIDFAYLAVIYLQNRKSPPPKPSDEKHGLLDQPNNQYEVITADLSIIISKISEQSIDTVSTETLSEVPAPAVQELSPYLLGRSSSSQQLVFTDIALDTTPNISPRLSPELTIAKQATDDPRNEMCVDSPYSVISASSVPSVLPATEQTVQQLVVDTIEQLRARFRAF